MRKMLVAGVVALCATLPAIGQEAGPRPPAEFILVPGEASAVPTKTAVAYANGGVIDVAQPNPTTIVVTMSGLTATNADLCRTSVASYTFELMQGFEVAFNSNRVKGAKLTIEGRVIGLLRTSHELYSHKIEKKCGTAETQAATAVIAACGGGPELVSLAMPSRSAGCCEDLSVYNHEGPMTVGISAGKYALHESWGFGTTHPAFICRGASAEFAPQPYYTPSAGGYWFEHWQPFNGTATKDFGYQVTIKLIPEFKPLEEKEEIAPPKDEKKDMPKEEKGK
jgi:hypothetical protein